jgi:hypothetical protein
VNKKVQIYTGKKFLSNSAKHEDFYVQIARFFNSVQIAGLVNPFGEKISAESLIIENST